MGNNDVLQSIWHKDNELFNILLNLKKSIITNLNGWKLEDAYWSLRSLWRESEAKFTKLEQDELVEDLKMIEERRKLYIKTGKSGQSRGEFYKVIEDFYIKLNRLMKKHGLWFREVKDVKGAVLDL